MLQHVLDVAAKAATASGILLALITGTVLIQMALRYTKPNIGYQVRNHRDREYTFFVRNLDSIHYKEALHLIVSGLGLRYVGIQAGPWSQQKPVRLEDELDARVRVLVVLEAIPEDAAFAIRATCIGDVPVIEVADDSPLRTRAFRKPLPKFTLITKARYYGLRYLIGVIGFLALFLGGLWFSGESTNIGDWILIGFAIIAAGLSFSLVIPFRGKTTIVGYLTSTEIYQYWGRRTTPSDGLLKE